MEIKQEIIIQPIEEEEKKSGWIWFLLLYVGSTPVQIWSVTTLILESYFSWYFGGYLSWGMMQGFECSGE